MSGCDISHWQGVPEMNALKASGLFVIAKATEGTGFVDPQFNNNRQKFRDFGILHGFYHFARPSKGNSPQAEADYFLNTVQIIPGELLALDYEDSYSGDVVGWCNAFLMEIKSRLGGYNPLIYLNQSLAKGHDWSPVVKNDFGLWLAQYNNNPPITTQWPVTAIQQNTDSLTVPGISGKCDGDIFFGDQVAWGKYCYQTITPPADPCANVKAELIAAQEQIIELQTELDSYKPYSGTLYYKD